MANFTVPSLKHHQGETIESFVFHSSWLDSSHGTRLDASHYNPSVVQAVKAIEQSGMVVKQLGDLVEDVFIPPRFKRIYVTEKHGVPFLQGSHVPNFKPTGLRYLSKTAHKNIHKWIIKSGWILVTCSGTTGRVAIAQNSYNEWAASQHILRIIPDDKKCPSGYLYAFLSSELGQVQLNSSIYGAVVDELTKEHVKNILVPLPESKEQFEVVRKIDVAAKKTFQLKDKALKIHDNAIDRTNDSFGVKKLNRKKAVSFAINSSLLDVDHGVRLDAQHYNPDLAYVLDKLKRSNLSLEYLGNIVEDVILPPRCKRSYVEKNYGVPFLQGSHIVHFQPTGLKYVSKVTQKKLSELTIQKGWILVTRSGTVGRAVLVPESWDGWAATEDLIQVKPDESKCLSGYLYAYLTSIAGQTQLTSLIHGAVVDHLTEDHVKGILVPVPKTSKQRKEVKLIDIQMKEAMKIKNEAVSLNGKTVNSVINLISKSTPQTSNKNLNHLEDFNDLITRSALPLEPHQT